MAVNAIYTRLFQTALRLLKKYGQQVVLRRYTQGGADYNPASGTATPQGPTGINDTFRQGLPTDAPGKRIGQQYGQILETNTLIQDTDRWMYLDANGASPTQQDHILYGGVDYAIVDVQVYSPGGLAMLYLIVLRA